MKPKQETSPTPEELQDEEVQETYDGQPHIPEGTVGSLSRQHKESLDYIIRRFLDYTVPLPNPLKKYELVLEAASMSKWRNREFRLEVWILNEQVKALLNPVITTAEGQVVHSIKWLHRSLDTDEKYERYFKDFDCTDIEDYRKLVIQQIGGRTFDSLPPRIQFALKTEFLTKKGFDTLVSTYIQAKSRRMSYIFRQVSANLNPESFKGEVIGFR